MSADGQIFVSIDPSSLQALVAQLQMGGGGGTPGEGGGGGGGGGISDPTNGWWLGDSTASKIQITAAYAGAQGITDFDPTGTLDSMGDDLPRIPYGLRTIMGVGARTAGMGSEGFQIAREYNLASGFLNAMDDSELTLGSAIGGGALVLLIAVQLKAMMNKFNAEMEKMKRDVERQSGINGSTYDRWLQIQSDPLMRRNI